MERPETTRRDPHPERIERSLATDTATTFLDSMATAGGATAGVLGVKQVVKSIGDHFDGKKDSGSKKE